jgi:2',3'-cyclic-nucleotide 2'-phosphodiesterase
LKIGFIGDIVGRPGRFMIKEHLQKIREEFNLDFVIANYENASHGFGLSEKNAKELFGYGIDVMTGGNHSFDKKEIISFFSKYSLLRPLNLSTSYGEGCNIFEINGKKLAVINLLGDYGMPLSDNPFTKIDEFIKSLDVDHIFVDFHSETTAEKRTLFHILKERVDMIVGTHTHIATDDYQISNNTFYITDVGLTGCYDNIIGMEIKSPIQRVLTGVSSHYNVPEPRNCKKILQMVIADFEERDGFSIKVFEDGKRVVREIFHL